MDNSSNISLGYLLQAIRRRWGTALVVGLLVLTGLGAAIFSLDPKYTSTAVVLLAPTAEQLSNDMSPHPVPMTDPFFIRSETDILSSDGLSRDVINRLKLQNDAEFQPKPGLLDLLGIPHAKKSNGVLSQEEVLLDHVVREYQDKLYVFNDGKSNTVEIQFTATNPREAAEIANTHAEAYLQQQSVRRNGAQQKATEWLAKEVNSRQEEVRVADAKVQQYQLQHGIVKANDSTLVEQRLGQLNSQLVDAMRNLSTQNAVLSEIRHIRAGGDAGSTSAMLTDEPLQKLLQSRVDAEADIAAMQKRLAPSHPNLVKRRQELASINNVLDQQLRRVETEATSNANWWQRQVDDLHEAVSRETTAKVGQDKVAAGLPALVALAQVKRTVFETVLNRYQTLLADVRSRRRRPQSFRAPCPQPDHPFRKRACFS
jgi:succinoglycan biosynthesis transport protein ExoP